MKRLRDFFLLVWLAKFIKRKPGWAALIAFLVVAYRFFRWLIVLAFRMVRWLVLLPIRVYRWAYPSEPETETETETETVHI